MRITKRQLKHIIQEELAQVVSERDQSTVRFPGVASVFNKGGRYNKTPYTPPPAADLRTSDPDDISGPWEDEFGVTQYPTNPSDPSEPWQDDFGVTQYPTSPDVDLRTSPAGAPAKPSVFQGKRGDPYEYQQVGDQYQARKKGSKAWNKVPKNSAGHKSIASVQGGGKSLYVRPKARTPKPVDAAPAQKPATPATPAVAAAPASAKQQKRNSLADAFEKAQRAKDGKGILTPKAQTKAAKIRKRGKKLNPFD
tara:strand:+ start:691 stop:1446 length:756 start_codon:yes stop_codon:yes gene_type:complete